MEEVFIMLQSDYSILNNINFTIALHTNKTILSFNFGVMSNYVKEQLTAL
jgi:hypothetical protein